MTPPATSSPAALPAWLWVACAAGGLVGAWFVVRMGYGMPVSNLLAGAAWLALGAIAEEVVFRGGLQHALLRRRAFGRAVGAISAANAITSLLFATVHLWNRPPLVALGVLPVSLLLGWIYERGDRRLMPPIVLHLYFNGALWACSRFAS